MNLDSLVKRGQLPWRPRPDATDLDVWHEYEIPLTGTFRVGSNLIMFAQVLETPSGLSAWAYVRIDPEDADEMAEIVFASVEDLRSFTEAKFQGQEAVLALASDGRLIPQWTRDNVGDGLVPTVERFINYVINQVPDTKQRVRAKFAGLEAASSELVAS